MKQSSKIGKWLYQKAKSWHKYLGVGLSLFLIWMSVSGIILNHPEAVADIGVPNVLVPDHYRPYEWNRSAMIDAQFIGKDTLFFAGKQGIWRSEDGGKHFYSERKQGFTTSPFGQKTNDLFYLPQQNKLFASTYQGLWCLDLKQNQWHRVDLGKYQNHHFVKMIQRQNQLILVGNSELLQSPIAFPLAFHPLSIKTKEAPFVDLISYFFALHSGWLFGLGGRLFMDLMALVLIFLSLTAIYIFLRKGKYFPFRKTKKSAWLKWSIDNHKQVGVITVIIMLAMGITGMFLRPPLLVALVGGKVKTSDIPTVFHKNPWYKTIHNATYDQQTDRLILETAKGIYTGKADGSGLFTPQNWKANVFVMGATVMEKRPNNHYLLGSFYGLKDYHEGDSMAINVLNHRWEKPYSGVQKPDHFMVTGYFQSPDGQQYFATHYQGLMNVNPVGKVPYKMPQALIDDYQMPLWNYMFEMHNGRLFSFIVGKYEILIIPLTGLLFFLLNITGAYEWGYRWWRKRR
ncbi:PepSY-associated TM helix domain-containing protein [Persicobacter psychrovividus]|uniref:Iron-regulated protein n=1 Tax=Persicobacter psychrovividus TaxID=387638 RepID=A0ABM7VB05_9BACT|nr:iron-regulated protein [Persicobacter psychrovividus]